MTYQKEPHVICLGDIKQAVLYFDKVIPVNHIQLQEHSNPAQLTRDLIDGFGSSNIAINNAFLGKLKEIQSAMIVMCDITKKLLGLKRNSKDAYNKELSQLPLDKRKAASNFVDYFVSEINNESKDIIIKKSFNILLGFSYMEDVKTNNGVKISTLLNQLGSLAGSKHFSVLLPEKCLLNDDEKKCDFSLILSNLNLIDTSETSWEQILEFRKDKDAPKKLRNLRLFFYDNYKEKDRQYIEDDLMKRLEDYEQTCKEWGFQTKNSTMTAILNSKNFQTSLYATLIGASFGQPVIMEGAVIAGTCIEIGKCVLHYTNRKHAFKNIKRHHDLAYIIEGKDRLKQSETFNPKR